VSEALPTRLDPALVARVRDWIDRDPDEQTRSELRGLLAAADAAALAERFAGRLRFGTAGLRAELGAGPMRMNRVVVREAAAGLVRFLGGAPRVVIGYDARDRSDAFARDTAGVVAASGGEALLFDRPVPTPVVAYAVRHLGLDAGVVCTASHNPPRDNGYKVYLADGAQLAPPADRQLAAAIDEAARGAAVAVAPPGHPGVRLVGDDVIDAYVEHAASTLVGAPAPAIVVYTPLHGVGCEVTLRVFERCGLTPPHVVAAQARPDGAFPTVEFPNPEEAHALDLALADARRLGADLVLAHDPDADRLGVAVPTPSGWRRLSGDELGILLADHVLRHGSGSDRLVATSFASSRRLSRLAAEYGVHYAETLTGFKWIVRPAQEHPEWRFVFGYEEALGYSIDPRVRDKDGITAAASVVALVTELAAAGRTVGDRLEEIHARIGHHASHGRSIRLEGAWAHGRLREAMALVRSAPPTRLGRFRVAEVVDFAAGGALPPTDAVALLVDGGGLPLRPGGRLLVRPSGTEPKIKLYAEVVAADGAPATIVAADRAAVGLTAVAARWLADLPPVAPSDV
jgi:phosphomannomutase